jgi:hypothetical protein
MDFELPHGAHDAVEIEPGAAASEPDDWDHLPADEGLHETLADAEPPRHVVEVGEVIAVIRQSAFGNHWNRFGNGRLSVVGLVELFDEFHDVLLLFPVGENPEFLVKNGTAHLFRAARSRADNLYTLV